MQRLEAISGRSAGSAALWMGESHVAAGARSADHHHGESESAIYVVSGHPEFVFLDDGVERRIRTQPGDYVYVPPFVPHREENPADRRGRRRRACAKHAGSDRREPAEPVRRVALSAISGPLLAAGPGTVRIGPMAP